jgi:cytidine deaminase
MKQISNAQLIQKAKKIVKIHKSSKDVIIGCVGCALISKKGNLYLGVSIHACCGIGFCAEHSAIASTVLNQEYQIKKIVAVYGNGTILPPCGRCRELMYEIDEKNYDTEIILGNNRAAKLKELLPEPWQKKRKI